MIRCDEIERHHCKARMKRVSSIDDEVVKERDGEVAVDGEIATHSRRLTFSKSDGVGGEDCSGILKEVLIAVDGGCWDIDVDGVVLE